MNENTSGANFVERNLFRCLFPANGVALTPFRVYNKGGRRWADEKNF
jgi:hypothetical protein